MVSKIRVLTDDTINKIAAGEVIENPASVVKELVENALDAAATEITVEIREGGRQLIRITDNGCGMGPDDVLLCLERHATSKLKDVDDIFEIGTMGFRGEAIPSIASISKFTLFSRPNAFEAKDEAGSMVIVDGGKILKCCSVDCSKGTTIEVKSLFFNVPVRRKFQKSPAYDTSEICRVLTLLALANPEVKFHLISNQESLLSTPGFSIGTSLDRMGERIRSLLGAEFMRGLCPVSVEEQGYRLEGFLGFPASAKHNRSGQYLFINRRAVVSTLIGYAIRDGYGTMLGTGRHPTYVLRLDLPGNLVDVNVHPQKREVRLRSEQQLRDLIIRAVGEALRRPGGLNGIEGDQGPLDSPFAASPLPSTLPSFSSPIAPVDRDVERFIPPDFSSLFTEENDGEMAKVIPAYKALDLRSVVQPQSKNEPENLLLPLARSKKEELTVIATIPRYILARPLHPENVQTAPVLCLIDQRAAHARILYEEFLQERNENCEMQTLLVPYTFDLPPAEAGLLREELPLLQKEGLHIKEFGTRTFMIDALAQFFGNLDVHKLVEEIVLNLHAHRGKDRLLQERHQQLALSASRSAISGERCLELSEAEQLVGRLKACQMPQICPRGKPTMQLFTLAQLAGLFIVK